MSGLPRGLRRHTQHTYLIPMGARVNEFLRVFESHFWQSSILASLRKNNYVCCWFSVKFCLFNQKILKSSLDIYYLCESIYWTSWSYSVFFIIIRWPADVRMAERSKAPDSRPVFYLWMGFLVHECGRGFESHFWQSSILLSLRTNNYVCCWFSVKFCLFNQKILKSTLDIYYLCESIYWTSWSYSVFFINMRWVADVRMAERSKAPYSTHVFHSVGYSGQRICTCVRIAFLTK